MGNGAESTGAVLGFRLLGLESFRHSAMVVTVLAWVPDPAMQVRQMGAPQGNTQAQIRNRHPMKLYARSICMIRGVFLAGTHGREQGCQTCSLSEPWCLSGCAQICDPTSTLQGHCLKFQVSSLQLQPSREPKCTAVFPSCAVIVSAPTQPL